MFKVGDRVQIIGRPAGTEFHGRYASIKSIQTLILVDTGKPATFLKVYIDNDHQERSWTTDAFRLLTPLEELL